MCSVRMTRSVGSMWMIASTRKVICSGFGSAGTVPTYCEVSPSGKGLKLIMRGTKPESARCKANWVRCGDNRGL